jgi:hypothetical protein
LKIFHEVEEQNELNVVENNKNSSKNEISQKNSSIQNNIKVKKFSINKILKLENEYLKKKVFMIADNLID